MSEQRTVRTSPQPPYRAFMCEWGARRSPWIETTTGYWAFGFLYLVAPSPDCCRVEPSMELARALNMGRAEQP